MNEKFLSTQEEVIQWLNHHHIKNYRIFPEENYGFVVSVQGHVNLRSMKLRHIPVKFLSVDKDFDCANNLLTCLEFIPKYIRGDLDISKNLISSLEYFPNLVRGNVFMANNPQLGELQSKRDFESLHLAHLKIQEIKQFKEKLVLDLKGSEVKKNNLKI